MPLTEKVILGTAQLGIQYGINNQTGKPSPDAVMDILLCASQNGIKFLDTAAGYGDAEKRIAQFHHLNHPFKIITKFSRGESFSVKAECERVLQLLKIRSLECFMYHRWNDTDDKELGYSLRDLRSSGQVQKIGVSVYDNEQFEKAIALEWIDVIQIPYNLLDNYSQRGELLKKAKARNKEIHSRSVFLQGLFFMVIESLPSKLKPLASYLNQLENISKKSGCSLAAIALQYPLRNHLVDKVIIGVEQKSQLENNLRAINERIDDTVFREIDSIKVKETELLSPVNW